MAATENASKNALRLSAAMLIACAASAFAADPAMKKPWSEGLDAALPQPLALAASWDPALVRDVHALAARRESARGVGLITAPVLDVVRDSRRGRVERTFGEDPFLVSEMGVAAISGLQGAKVTAAAMHFAGPALPGDGTEVGPVPIAERELREVYFPPFEAAIRRANVKAIVVSRNELDGIPSLANAWLLKDVLRGEWKYKGALYAGKGAIAEVQSVYGVGTKVNGVEGIEHAALAPNTTALDAAGRSLALKAAQRSIVLLKNDGALPLADGSSSVVVEVADGEAATYEARIDTAKATGRPVIVVLTSARAPLTVKMSEQANALLAAWNLGEQGSAAVKSVLTGEVSPGGKLPLTLARNAGQLPTFYNVKPSARRGYLFDTTEPLYVFGWGLGYTTFSVSAPTLSAATMEAKGSVQAAVEVRNTGKAVGDETVQLYVRDKVSSVTRPVLELKGFQRVTLKPGEARTVTFKIDARSLEMWDERMQRVVESGEFEILAGSSSKQLQSALLTVVGRPGQ